MRVGPGSIRDDILHIEQIPPLSATASELLRAAVDPDIDAQRLTRILERDPALAARIVGLANSAFFAQRRPVLGLEEAIIRVLGLNMVRSLALSMALAGSFDTSRCPAYDLKQYWLVALGSGSLSRDLARAVGKDTVVHPDAAYLCGLLHSLGQLALLHLRPHEMCEAVHAQRDEPGSDLVVLERQYLGIDSWEAGEALAKHWHLPEMVVNVMSYFSGYDVQGPNRALIQVVAAARAWVMASLAGDLPQVDPPDAGAAEFQRIVSSFKSQLADLQQQAELML